MNQPTLTKRRKVHVRCYEFEGGILYLKKFMHHGRTDEQIAEDYGVGKGKLLQAWDDQADLKWLNSLDSFTEL